MSSQITGGWLKAIAAKIKTIVGATILELAKKAQANGAKILQSSPLILFYQIFVNADSHGLLHMI